jgi:hypothetical protein
MKPAGRLGVVGVAASRFPLVSWKELRDQALIECPITPWRGQSLEGQEMSNFAMEARKPHGHQAAQALKLRHPTNKINRILLLPPQNSSSLECG